LLLLDLSPSFMARPTARTAIGLAKGPGSQTPLADIPGAMPFAPLQKVASNHINISQTALDAAEEYAAQRNSTAMIVWHKGKVAREVYFGGTSKDTLISSGALAKPMAVLAVGRAIKEGYIESLDQPASDFFNEWQGTPKEQISIRHLLGMRSGLLPQDFTPDPESIMTRAYLHPCHEDIIINDYPLVHKPSSRYEYSNVNSELLAPLIERATGFKYANWLSDQLVVPLGAKGGQLWINRPNGVAHSGCCALLPADTYLRFAMLIALNGTWGDQDLLTSDFVLAMKSSTAQNANAGMGLYIGSPFKERRGPLNPEVSLGAVFHAAPYVADDLVLFDGNANQVAYIVPSEELVILRVGRWPDKGKEWDNSYLPNTILRSIVSAP
jgi:CubicO group peptidase (beta-lactamase class C family)